MPTIRDLILGAERTLRSAGVDSPRLDAELLLAHALGADRSTVLRDLAIAPPREVASRFDELVGRRMRREPVAYITGWKEFWGRPFEVNRHVLIPRPETELLIERALSLARNEAVIVDVGTGSGCIAVTLALELPRARVYATDVSAEALEVARRNAERLGAANVTFLRGSLLEPVPEQADVVVANLPYLPAAGLEALEPEVRAWEPRGALVGGASGTDVIEALLGQLSARLASGGACLLEIDPPQVEAVTELARSVVPLAAVKRHHDLAGRPRVVELAAALTPS